MNWMPVSDQLDRLADLEDPDPELWGKEPPEPSTSYRGPDWHQAAACASYPSRMFFGPDDTTERPALSVADVARAKSICATCPVFRECLTKALGAGENAPREEYGIWAGTSGRTRKRIWDLVEREEISLEDVIDDICCGFTERYERKQKVTLSVSRESAVRLVPLREAVSA